MKSKFQNYELSRKEIPAKKCHQLFKQKSELRAPLKASTAIIYQCRETNCWLLKLFSETQLFTEINLKSVLT